MNLLFHVGFPKTSSSTLQYGLFKPLHDSNELNLITWRKDNDKEALIKRLSSRLFNRKKLLKKHLNLSNEKINIISDESLTAPLRLRWNNYGKNILNPYFFPDKLSEYYSINSNNSKVLMIIRNQRDLLFSQHVEEYNLVLRKKDNLLYRGHNINLEGLDIYNFSEYILKWRELLPEKSVKVVLFEELKYNPEKFFYDLSVFLNISKSKIKDVYNKNKVNSKKKTKNGYLTNKSNIEVKFLSDDENNIIFNYYKKSNLKLPSILDMDPNLLKKYGYI